MDEIKLRRIVTVKIGTIQKDLLQREYFAERKRRRVPVITVKLEAVKTLIAT